MRPDPTLQLGLRPAAALLLIYPHGDGWQVPLTVRGSGLRHHTGQVSLPGGRLDRPDESVEEAALRSGRSLEAAYKALTRIRKLLFDCVSHQLAAGGAA